MTDAALPTLGYDEGWYEYGFEPGRTFWLDCLTSTLGYPFTISLTAKWKDKSGVRWREGAWVGCFGYLSYRSLHECVFRRFNLNTCFTASIFSLLFAFLTFPTLFVSHLLFSFLSSSFPLSFVPLVTAIMTRSSCSSLAAVQGSSPGLANGITPIFSGSLSTGADGRSAFHHHCCPNTQKLIINRYEFPQAWAMRASAPRDEW